jgi:YbbR domain-containing protein
VIRNKISEFIKKDIVIKIAAVIIGLILWNFVLNINNPLETRVFTVSITEINKNSLYNKSLSLENEDYRSYIPVRVTGRLDKINKINQSDFEVVADFSKIEDVDDEKIKLDTEYIGNQDLTGINIKFDIEYLEIKVKEDDSNPYSVNIILQGEPKQDYRIIKKDTSPEDISLSSLGDNSDEIAQVKTFIDVSGLDKDMTITSPCKFYDKYGDELEDLDGSRNVEVNIEVAKEVKVEAFISGTPADGLQVGKKTVFPETLLLKGDSDKLKSLENIKTESIDVNNLSETKNFTSTVVLPDGVTIAVGNANVSVNIEINNLSKITVAIFKDDIQIKNKASDYEYEIESSSILIELIGEKDEIIDLDAESLKPYIDVEDFTDEDQYVNLNLSLPDGITVAEEYTVEISMKKN